MPEFLGSGELFILVLLLLVLFGAKRLPDSARALGRSLRIFKAETRGLRDDQAGPAGEGAPASAAAPPAAAAPAAIPPAPPAVVPPAAPVQDGQRPAVP